MSAEQVSSQDPRIQEAVTEIKKMIARQYPTATFEILRGEDPEGNYLTATVDTDDLTIVLAIVVNRLVDFQVDQGLPLYLVPVRPLERVERELREPGPRIASTIDFEASTAPARTSSASSVIGTGST